MKSWKRLLAGGLLFAAVLGMLAGCAPKKAEKPQVTLTVKLPPLTVANANSDITDAYDLLVQAGQDGIIRRLEFPEIRPIREAIPGI